MLTLNVHILWFRMLEAASNKQKLNFKNFEFKRWRRSTLGSSEKWTRTPILYTFLISSDSQILNRNRFFSSSLHRLPCAQQVISWILNKTQNCLWSSVWRNIYHFQSGQRVFLRLVWTSPTSIEHDLSKFLENITDYICLFAESRSDLNSFVDGMHHRPL